MPCKCVPVKLISAFQSGKSSSSRPNTTIQHSYINDIKKIISNIDPADSFNSWDHIYLDEPRWTNLVEALESKQ